mgnify:CR=1 FL=1
MAILTAALMCFSLLESLPQAYAYAAAMGIAVSAAGALVFLHHFVVFGLFFGALFGGQQAQDLALGLDGGEA